MLERYIVTPDGEEYINTDCLREALGITDEDANPFVAIKKLKEESERYKSNVNYFAGIAQDRQRDINKLELGLRETLGTVDEYADILGLVRKLKQERDALKDKVVRMKKRQNALYGASCGYSSDDTPVFKTASFVSCSFSYTGGENTEIEATFTLYPNANYKGEFDIQNFANYITHYDGRKVSWRNWSDLERTDYEIAKSARVELAELYKRIFGVEKLDYNLGPKDISNAIMDECTNVRNDRFVKAEKNRVLEKFRDSVCDILGTTTAMTDLYILKRIEKLQKQESSKLERHEKFRRDVAKRIGRDPDVIKTPEVTLHALDVELERGEKMDHFRDKLIDILGYKLKPEGVGPNNQAILEKVKKLRETNGNMDKLCNEMAVTLDHLKDILGAEDDSELVKTVEERLLELYEAKQKYSRYCLAIGSLCSIPEEHREDISWIEDAFNSTKEDYLKLMTEADKLARLRSDICSALCLGHESCDGNIIGRIRMHQDCHNKLRKAIWDAMGRKPETLPNDNARLVGEVLELARGEKLLIEFRDGVAKAIGKDYPTTNNVLLTTVQYIYKDRGEAYDIVTKLSEESADLKKKVEVLESRYRDQYQLRQQWHVRYESEHERANGVQKKLDKLRGIEAERDKYKENCTYWHDMYDSSEMACGALKGKIRELQKELKEERHPNLTEFQEEHPIDTDPGYLRKGEEESNE